MLNVRRLIILVLSIFIVSSFAEAQNARTIEADLLRHLNNLAKWSNYGGTRNQTALDNENKVLKGKLLKYGRQLSTLKYEFKALSGKIFIVTSKDGRFRIYSWDTESGGTMHFFENVFQYQGRGGKVYSKIYPEAGDLSARGFYTQIFQMDTPRRRVYLANSTFILSNPMAHQELELYAIDGEKLNSNVRLIRTRTGLHNSIGFDYDFFSVVGHAERPLKLVYFDDPVKSFRIPVVLTDKKFVNGGRVTNRFITYKFDGNYFVKVR